MKISIFGLGYVGCVSAACLAEKGHHVIGVDINQQKVDQINSGVSPIVEPGLYELIEDNVNKNLLSATTLAIEAVQKSDISLVCVGTPSKGNGSLDLQYIRNVAKELGQAIRRSDEYHSVVLRSTMLPGSTENDVIPILEEASEKKTGKDFGLVFNPEFLREGSAIDDFYHPSRIVIGEFNQKSGDITEEIYQDIDAPIVRTGIKVAEMVKYADNSFHGLKVAFANEIGNFCKKNNIDSHKVMEIFCMDSKLNLSPYYLKPGSAFGGSCLPKDIRALMYAMRRSDLAAPVIEAIIPSNELQKEKAVDLVLNNGRKKVGILGLSFKVGTDDLRESPTVFLVEQLLGKGYDVKIYDPNIELGNLMGSNRAYIEKRLPHIAELIVDSGKKVVSGSDIIVIANKEEEFVDLISSVDSDKILIDLVRLINNPTMKKGTKYHGIAW